MALISSGQLTLLDMNDVLASPTQPGTATEGALWLNTTDNQVYVYSNGAWRLSANYTQYVASRGESLVTNGTGLMGTNYNFSGFTFDKSDSYNVTGSFKDASYNVTRTTDELMPVDISKTYRLSVWGKCNPYVGAHYYIGVSMYDVDGYNITSDNHMYLANTLTTLAQDLKNGDTVVYLTSAANWNNSVGSATYKRKFIFWDYKNSAGYQYPENTYSRHVSGSDLWADGSINTTNNTITLRAAWNGGTVVAGTKLSQSSQGGTYKYCTASNATIPATWTQYTGTIGGVDYSGTNVTGMFSPGTASVKLLFLNNRDTTGSTVWYSNLSFNVDVASQGDVDGINQQLSDLADDSKITRFERSLVRGDIADITGLWLNPTDVMPSLASIDAGTVGNLRALRKSAVNLGVPTGSGSNYSNLGSSYTSLVTYLTAMTPKPWDVTGSGVITVTPTTWVSTWKSYYDNYNLLQIEVQDKQKAYADAAASNAQSGAIAAVQNAVAHATATIANPMTINAPVATIGLPEYQGRHADSWYVGGKNLALQSNTVWDSTVYNVIQGTLSEDWVVGAGYTITIKGTLNAGQKFGLWRDTGSTTAGYFTYDATADLHRLYVSSMPSTTQTVYNKFSVYNTPSTTATSAHIEWIKIERGNTFTAYTPAPEDVWGSNGNRIKPILSPTFTTGTSLTMNVALYGDGTNNDSISWDMNGNLVKVKKWEDVPLDNTQNWSLNSDGTGYKTLKATGFADTVVDNSASIVKWDSNYLTAVTTRSAGDQFTLASSDLALYITVKDTDSGWGESYSPAADEIGAYFLGWEMCNGTYNTPYTGAANDVKTWYPIGDADLSRAANITDGTPTIPSPALIDKKINYYQVVYQLSSPLQVSGFTFDGLLTLIQGNNTINITYPTLDTPAITTGTVKYATNLATAQQDLTYIIPSTMTRLSSAENKVLKDSLVSTVTTSVEYQTALAGKADQDDLSGLASAQDVTALGTTVDGLNTAVNGADGTGKTDGILARLSTFVTTAQMTTTSTSILESFYQGGGMNLIKNSIGFAGLDYWNLWTSANVLTTQNLDLDQLGFGKGFYFKADGQNKGITQDIPVVPGQHFTLSWYLNKMTSGADNTYRFYVQIIENGVTTMSIADNSAITTNGYEASYVKYTATSNMITVRFIGYANVEAIVTGIMFTIGDTPIKWTLATGEAYNTYIRMNLNGIRVSQLDDNKQEVSYTMMSPTEFAGYFDANKDGSFEKIFFLNGEETVSKKVRAKNEIVMGALKVTRVPSAQLWESLTPYIVGDTVSVGRNTYKCTVAGTSGSTAPTHTSGTAVDGTVTWTFVSTSAYVGWAFVPS